jgi:O-antigen ligase
MALYMQTLIPFVIFWLVRQHTWSRRLLALGVLVLLSVAHLLSFTRGALITTALMLVLFFWLVDKRRLLLLGPLVALCGCIALMSWEPMRNRAMTLLAMDREEAPDRENTAGWRLRTIPVGIDMMLKRPILGTGIGQQRWNWPPSVFGSLIPDPEVAQPLPIHNSYLLIGIETGLGGLCALLMLLVTAIRESARLGAQFRRQGDQELADAGVAISVAMVGLALAMLMYPMTENFRYFWLLIGMTAALMRIEGQAPIIRNELPAAHEIEPATSPPSLR